MTHLLTDSAILKNDHFIIDTGDTLLTRKDQVSTFRELSSGEKRQVASTPNNRKVSECVKCRKLTISRQKWKQRTS